MTATIQHHSDVARSTGSAAGLLPGVNLPLRPAAPRPDRLAGPGSLLLADLTDRQRRSWPDHLLRHGPLPPLDLNGLADAAEVAALRGFGGAAFPTAVKLRAAHQGRAPLVVVNAAEGEQASAKDGVLLRHAPHTVLDGALLTARTLGAETITVRLADDRRDLPAILRAAARERGDAERVRISVGPSQFAAGEASAVINGVSGRAPLPSPLGRPPSAPARIGSRSRPALVSNAETFARLALAARHQPSHSALLTISGAVATPGVVELPTSSVLGSAVLAAGGVVEPVAALVTGGWHGRWLPWTPAVESMDLSRDGVEEVGGRWGAGVFVLMPASVCPLVAVAAVARTLAAGSAGQCGPCRSGLPFVADRLVAGAQDPTYVYSMLNEVDQALGSLRGRGFCAHPTASADALRSALSWAHPHLDEHGSGRCVA